MALLQLIDGALASMDGCNTSTNTCIDQALILERVHQINPATIVSSILSLLGSLAIIAPFFMWSDLRRSTARKILFLLAVSDLFTAVGYLAASSMYYYFYDSKGELKENYTKAYYYFCSGQAFTTTYFPITSFFWTTYLAVYFVVTLVFHLYHWSRKLLVVFNLTAWGIPLVICITTVGVGILGSGKHISYSSSFRSTEDAAGWCFVSSQIMNNASSCEDFRHRRILYLAMEAVCGKMWEILAYLIVAVCYVLIFATNHVCKSRKKPKYYRSIGHNGSQRSKHIISEALVKVDMKLLFIPIVFIFLRSWGTIRYFISWMPDCHHYYNESTERHACVSERCFNLFYSEFLLGMQAFCDPLQGFGNAILFICLSRPIRHRVISSLEVCVAFCCALCCKCVGKRQGTRRSFFQANAIPNITFESNEGQDEREEIGDEPSSMLGCQQKPTYGSTCMDETRSRDG